MIRGFFYNDIPEDNQPQSCSAQEVEFHIYFHHLFSTLHFLDKPLKT